MKIVFNERAWQEYIFWVSNDKTIVKKINELIKDIIIDPYSGIGKPEKFKYDKKDLYSRRINLEHRLVYHIENDNLIITSCKYHYSKE
ncbi:Txe/YoeB family addiction module toxin [Brachyspira hampsonii]|uniref:Putative mRNA interferase YoeB n=2 Tax=Brachyspira hampsonii TaxID=1287055 RepID=A0AAC9TUA2_9SPIR|nr:Txe/YoeB family addiction module toxin [Brachyspira hampsonii]ASJ22038.1 toxin YoeB [Brachyspira hampsonii]ELV05550.1 plasmid encoded toxin [Brachyspira hampsonii 30599]OEJ17729.1 toxin YoeB [Brachyspira hampsonii]